MMRKIGMAAFIGALGIGLIGASAHEEHEHAGKEHAGQEQAGAAISGTTAAQPTEQTLTGEVMDVMCYLGHDQKAQGSAHAECAQKCIKSGLPVAIKVGDKLYLATKADHKPANDLLAPYAGQQVEVHGKVMERDGQRLIAISKAEKAD